MKHGSVKFDVQTLSTMFKLIDENLKAKYSMLGIITIHNKPRRVA